MKMMQEQENKDVIAICSETNEPCDSKHCFHSCNMANGDYPLVFDTFISGNRKAYAIRKNIPENRIIVPQDIRDVIAGSELVKLAVIEAIHRYYYDNVLNEYFPQEELDKIGDLLSNAWCMYPDWRRRIVHIITTRYKFDDQLMNDVLLVNKPAKIVSLLFEGLNIDIKRT